MTHGALHVSAIALGVAAFVSMAPLSTAIADSSAPASTSGGVDPSLSEPAPTPSIATSPSGSAAAPGGAESGSGVADIQRPSRSIDRHYAHDTRHWRSAHRYRYGGNPVAAATRGVVGGMADLGSIAAYPFYCFPRYGSCRVHLPYP